MKTKRLLIVLAAILLSCGFLNAQTQNDAINDETTQTNDQTDNQTTTDPKDWDGDVNRDQKLNTEDIIAAADSVMENKTSESADVNKDKKVNVADVVSVVYLIQRTNYFLLGTEVPTKDNYTLVDGVTAYESLDKALEAALTIEVAADKTGVLLCPSSWDAKDLVLQNEKDGTIYDFAATDNDISDYDLFQTDKISAAATLKLKSKTAAEDYKKSLTPANSNYFWMGTFMPKSTTFPIALDGEDVAGIVTTYTSLDDAMAKASHAYSSGEWGVVMYPSSWGTKSDLVFLDKTNKKYYALKKKDLSDFPDYTYYETTQKIGAKTTITLSTEADAKAAGATLYGGTTPVNPDPVNPTPTSGYFWMGTYMPTSTTFPKKNGEDVAGIVTTYTSLDDAMAKASHAYSSGEWGVVMYPSSWGTKSGLVFLDKTNKKYYALKKKDLSDFPNYTYYETTQKIGAKTTITLSTESAAKAAGATLYGGTTPVNPDPVTPVNPDPVTPSGIKMTDAVSYVSDGTPGTVTFNLINKTGQKVYLSGKFSMYIKPNNPYNAWGSDGKQTNGTDGMQCNLSGPTYTGDGWPHWWSNPITIDAGKSKAFVMKSFRTYTGNGSTVTYKDTPLSTYFNGKWYFINSNNAGANAAGGTGGILAIKLATAHKDGSKITNSCIFFIASPMKASDSKLVLGKTYNIIIFKANSNNKYWSTIIR